jgi:hypothetical protein
MAAISSAANLNRRSQLNDKQASASAAIVDQINSKAHLGCISRSFSAETRGLSGNPNAETLSVIESLSSKTADPRDLLPAIMGQ